MLRVDRLSAGYGEVSVLREVSLSIAEGEIVGVIGSNGGGKTTLLKTLSGLVSPHSGRIEFLGERIDGLPPHEICKRGLIQVPEGRQVFPKMKVLHNLEMGAYLPAARKIFQESIEKVYHLFPLFQERKSQKAGLLSGGEQQMLAIARALMARPRLLMLDEPSEGLAPVMTEKIFEILKNLSEQGLTIFLISQEVFLTLELAHRAYVLENGQIALEGPSRQLLDNDQVRASYLGI